MVDLDLIIGGGIPAIVPPSEMEYHYGSGGVYQSGKFHKGLNEILHYIML